MVRKQFYLTPEIDRELDLAARREGRAVAEIIREILVKGLKIKQPTKSGGKVLMEMAIRAATGPKNLSKDFSAYLYGSKSPNYGKTGKASR